MRKSWIKLLTLLLVLLLLSQVLQQVPSVAAFDRIWVAEQIRCNGIFGLPIFIGLSALLLSVGLPRQLLAFSAGCVFGMAQGVVYSTLAASLSCILTFYLSRYFARALVVQLLPGRIPQLDAFLRHDPLLKSMLVRLLPIGNNLITNLVAGVTRIAPAPFVIGSTLGYLPQMLIFALMGKGLAVNSELKLMLSVALLAVSSSLGAYLLVKQRRQRGPVIATKAVATAKVETLDSIR